jgi:hypothetical protein
MKTPEIPPAVVESKVWMKFKPMLKPNAGAIRNLMLLTAKTINIFKNPDKVYGFPDITLFRLYCCTRVSRN